MHRFSQAEPFMLAHVIREETPEAVLREYAAGEGLARRGCDVHISTLETRYKTPEVYERIFSAIKEPVLAINYDSDKLFRRAGIPQETRLSQLEEAVKCGAASVDLQGFAFEPKGRNGLENVDPKQYVFAASGAKEVTVNEEAIEKQCRYIEKIHSLGGEVLLSTHTSAYLDTEQAVALALFLEKRDPDIIKLVTVGCDTRDRVAECIRTVIELKKTLKCRFSFHCNGKFGKETRLLGPLFGSYMAFAVREYGPGYDKNQLRLADAAAFFDQKECGTFFRNEAETGDGSAAK